jgi:predicted transcriptional regulator
MKLKDYLEKYEINVTAFCQLVNLSRTQLYRIINGQEPKLSTAIRIVKATYGKVKFEDLVSNELQDKKEDSDQ